MADPAGVGDDEVSEVHTLYGEYRNSRGVVRSLIRDCRTDYNLMRTHQERIIVSKRERRPFAEIRALCQERDACRQNLDGHLDELRAAQNAHSTDITDIIDALEPYTSDDIDDPENASSPESDSINTRFVAYVVFAIFFVVLFIVLFVGSRGSGHVADLHDFDDGIEAGDEGGDEDDEDDGDEGDDVDNDLGGAAAVTTTTTTTTTNEVRTGDSAVDEAIEADRGNSPATSPVNLPALEVLALVGTPPPLEPHPEVKQEISDDDLQIVTVGGVANDEVDSGAKENDEAAAPGGDEKVDNGEPMEIFDAPAPQFIRPPAGGPTFVTSVVRDDGEILAQYELDGRYCAPPSGNIPARLYLCEGVPIPQGLFRDRTINTVVQIANVRPEAIPAHLVLLFPIIEIVNPAPYGFCKDGTPAAKRGRKRRR